MMRRSLPRQIPEHEQRDSKNADIDDEFNFGIHEAPPFSYDSRFQQEHDHADGCHDQPGDHLFFRVFHTTPLFPAQPFSSASRYARVSPWKVPFQIR